MNKKSLETKKKFKINPSLENFTLANSMIASLYYFMLCDDPKENNFFTIWFSKTHSTSSLTYYSYLKQKKLTPLTLGLGAHTIGDSLLAINNQEILKSIPFFMLGHIFYTYELSKKPFIKTIKLLPKRKNKITALCFYALFINTILHDNVDEKLQVAIPIYTLALLSTALMESLLKTQQISLFIGLLNYILSDSLIAINTFMVKIPYENKISWALYYSSQLLISHTLISSTTVFNQEINNPATPKPIV